MSPDKLVVALRPRTGWEAIDLGLRLAQRCAQPLLGGSLVLVLGVALLAFLVFDVALRVPGWAVFIVWWLKPLYDRLHLHALSRAVFDDTPTVSDSLRALPHLFWNTGVFAALTWRRLGTQRAVCLPVTVLEGLRGFMATARRALLLRRIGNTGLGLIFSFSMFEMALILGVYALVALLVPNDPISGTPDLKHFFEHLFWEKGREATLWAHGIQLFVYAVVVACVEPFYVAGGFGLYLKRRTDLEAWDIELQFRRLQTVKALGALLMVGAFAALTLAMPQPAQAQPPEALARREQAALKAGTLVQQVLKNPDFGHDEILHLPHWRESKDVKEKPKSSWHWPQLPWLKHLADWLAPLAKGLVALLLFVGRAPRYVVYAALGVCLAVILVLVLRHVRTLRLSGRAKRAPPAEVMGMDIRPESLPPDIPDAARALFAQGQTRPALALLYRGALSRLAHGEGIAFEAGDTEGDCMQRVAQARSPARPGFSRLTLAWQAVAYARRSLALDEAYALCASWQESFGGAR